MSRAEINSDMNSQAQTALSYLEYTRLVTTGGEDATLRERLSKDEENTKDSALTCLMSYFEKDLDGTLTTLLKSNKTISKTKAEVKKLNIKKEHGQRH